MKLHSLLKKKKKCFLTAFALFSGEGNGNPLQYSCLENPMDGGAWWATVHGVAESRMWLRDLTFTFHFSLSCIGEGNGNLLQCSCLENPRDGGPGGLPSMGSHRVGHDGSDLAAAAALFSTGLLLGNRNWQAFTNNETQLWISSGPDWTKVI